MTGARLRKTMFAVKVRDAYNNGDLGWDNVSEWVTKFNGWFDETLRKEVYELLNWFDSGRDL